MATLQREEQLKDDSVHTSDGSEVTMTDPSQHPVPTPFPQHALQQQQQGQHSNVIAGGGSNRTDSRSPRRQSLTRAAGGLMDKVKRVVSASRERGSSQRGASANRFGGLSNSPSSQDRNRSRERGTNTEDTRGRAGQQDYANKVQNMPPLQHTQSDIDGSTLRPTVSRSTSRGRPIFSVGRGGAGNMLEVSDESAELKLLNGDEPEEVVRKAREELERERSASRERTGREEFVASGRGGQGNIRSRSRGRDLLDLGRVPTVQEQQEREQLEAEETREKEIIEKHAQAQAKQSRWFTSGRGGAGNVRHTGPS